MQSRVGTPKNKNKKIRGGGRKAAEDRERQGAGVDSRVYAQTFRFFGVRCARFAPTPELSGLAAGDGWSPGRRSATQPSGGHFDPPPGYRLQHLAKVWVAGTVPRFVFRTGFRVYSTRVLPPEGLAGGAGSSIHPSPAAIGGSAESSRRVFSTGSLFALGPRLLAFGVGRSARLLSLLPMLRGWKK